MNYIIAIVGPSGCGKTTISRSMAEAGIPDVVSYTTRPIRHGETPNVEHIFISHTEAISIIEQKEIAAYTEFGDFIYFTTMEQLQNQGYCSYVVDEPGLMMLQSNLADHEDVEVIPVFVRRDKIGEEVDQQRRDRDINRHWLDRSYYDVIINNDAPDAHALELWSYRFALALLAVLPVRHSVHRCELNTSDARISNIINKLNNTRSAI